MKTFLILAAVLFPYFAQAATLYMEGIPTIKNGVYESLQSTEIKFVTSESLVKICGINKFRGNKIGQIDRSWTMFGKYLYFGREIVGEISDGNIRVERKYTVQDEPQTQLLILQWNENEKTFIYALKDTYMGGFQSEGKMVPSPSTALKEACGE